MDWEAYNIALDLGLPVRLEEFSGGDPLAFVIVNCLHQPHWYQGQRAVLAVRLHAWRERGRPGKSVPNTDFQPSESEPQPKTGAPASTAEIADSAQVSPTFITRAKRVEELGLGEAVISGELKLAEAYRRVKLVLDTGLGHMIQSGPAGLRNRLPRGQSGRRRRFPPSRQSGRIHLCGGVSEGPGR